LSTREEKVGFTYTIGCSTNCYHGFDLETALHGIADAGFHYVELASVRDYTEHVMPERMNEHDKRMLRDQLKDYGLSPMSISGHSDLSASKGVDDFKRRVDLAKWFGATVVNTGPGEVENPEGKKRFFNNMETIALYAAQAGVTVALETHGELMGSGRAAASVMERIDSPWVRINYDTGNVIFYGDVNPKEDISSAIPFLGHIHLKDKRGGKKVWDFPPLGMGEVDFPSIFSTLEEARYAGPISVEIEVSGKDYIPSWLVSDEKGEIVSTEKERHGSDVVDKALKESLHYIQSLTAAG
jgi:sugar phosphate isomerase/epimerase